MGFFLVSTSTQSDKALTYSLLSSRLHLDSTSASCFKTFGLVIKCMFSCCSQENTQGRSQSPPERMNSSQNEESDVYFSLSFIFNLLSIAAAARTTFRRKPHHHPAVTLCYFVAVSCRVESSPLCMQRLVSLLLRWHHFSIAIHLCACCQATPDMQELP